VLSKIVTLFVNVVVTKLVSWLSSVISKFKRKKERDTEVVDSQKKLEEANSAEEISKATDDVFRKL
jgi:K+-sensing histidine kinase KdpD